MEGLVTSPTKQKSVHSSMIGSQKTGSQELEVDARITSFVYKNNIRPFVKFWTHDR